MEGWRPGGLGACPAAVACLSPLYYGVLGISVLHQVNPAEDFVGSSSRLEKKGIENLLGRIAFRLRGFGARETWNEARSGLAFSLAWTRS